MFGKPEAPKAIKHVITIIVPNGSLKTVPLHEAIRLIASWYSEFVNLSAMCGLFRRKSLFDGPRRDVK